MKYRRLKGYKYQLAENYMYSLPAIFPDVLTEFIIICQGWITIKEGYTWDGPSGPTLDTHDFMTGALVHDALYQLIRHGLLPESYRIEADKVLYSICRQDGMPWWRANYVYQFVRWFGGNAVKPRPEEPYDVIIEV